MLRFSRLFLSTATAAGAASSSSYRPTFTLKPIVSHGELDQGLALASKVFSEEEGLSVIQKLTAEQFGAAFADLHESLDVAAEKGIHLSFLAVEDAVEGVTEGGRVGASFIVFPSNLKKLDEEKLPKPFIPVANLLDYLYDLADHAAVNVGDSAAAAAALKKRDTPLVLPSNFSSYTPLANTNKDTTVWFGIAAVAPFARGQGLQKLAKKAVIEAAKGHGYKSMVTECTSSASAKSMMASVKGLETDGAFARVTVPYAEYNGGEFGRCVTEFNCDAIVLVEELF